MIGVELGLPITLINPEALSEKSSLAWHLTPYGQIGAAASVDVAAGGILGGGGVVGALDVRINDTTITLGNHAAYLSGMRIGYHGDFASGYTAHGGDVTVYFCW
jgi:hypothetical protein